MKTVLQHTTGWVLFVLTFAIKPYVQSDFRFMELVYIFAYTPINTLVFYAIFFFVYRYYDRYRRVDLAIVNYLSLCFIYILLTYLYVRYGLSHLPGLADMRNLPLNKLTVTDILLNYTEYTLYSLLYWQLTRAVRAERRLRVSETEKLKIRYEQLRAQINPHFLYNTLNFFYAKTAAAQPEVAEGIEKLTEIMRYSLQGSNQPDDKVLLSSEIEQVENVIGIHQLRYRNGLYIRFDKEGDPAQMRIIPHILITLVENTLKYGVITNAATPVVLTLRINNSELEFVTDNVVRESVDRSHSTGVGLSNIRQRLAQVYGKDFSFTAGPAENNRFITKLIIHL
jgi:two-component system, LytTR family, sensor kinase